MDETLATPTVDEARSAYRQAWASYCLGMTREHRLEQLMLMAELKPYCALVRDGREWQRFVATIPGYVTYASRRKKEEHDEG